MTGCLAGVAARGPWIGLAAMAVLLGACPDGAPTDRTGAASDADGGGGAAAPGGADGRQRPASAGEEGRSGGRPDGGTDGAGPGPGPGPESRSEAGEGEGEGDDTGGDAGGAEGEAGDAPDGDGGWAGGEGGGERDAAPPDDGAEGPEAEPPTCDPEAPVVGSLRCREYIDCHRDQGEAAWEIPEGCGVERDNYCWVDLCLPCVERDDVDAGVFPLIRCGYDAGCLDASSWRFGPEALGCLRRRCAKELAACEARSIADGAGAPPGDKPPEGSVPELPRADDPTFPVCNFGMCLARIYTCRDFVRCRRTFWPDEECWGDDDEVVGCEGCLAPGHRVLKTDLVRCGDAAGCWEGRDWPEGIDPMCRRPYDDETVRCLATECPDEMAACGFPETVQAAAAAAPGG